MALTADQRKRCRTIIRLYLESCERNRSRIHYSQFRPITSLGDLPQRGFTTDCSGLVISAFYQADREMPIKIKDPGGYAYSGWGYTGSILETNRSRRVPLDHKFFIGDMCLMCHLRSRCQACRCRRRWRTCYRVSERRS